LALPFFSRMVGQFCQGFCLRYAYADWNPRFLINLMPDITANTVEWFRQACQVCKSLINLKERRTAMDMISAQTFRYSISDAGCP
jgi:hypothetical protein